MEKKKNGKGKRSRRSGLGGSTKANRKKETSLFSFFSSAWDETIAG